ncbi:MAG: hypothetical protein NPINA01_18450 [Nitrospinaceae bacterium]|nr:MAG: hypothetical protein NPINA01_18450 [Nitrospinaceae bacterium]
MDYLSPLQNQGSVFSRMTEQKLDQLTNQATSEDFKDGEELKKLAGQFESILVNMLMKSMRETIPKDGLLSSFSLDMYQSMFDQEVAAEMSKSKGKGIGLAQVMYDQLSRINENKPDAEKIREDSKSSPAQNFSLKEYR